MDRPVRERIREGIVDEPVLVEERQAREARTGDRRLEVVAAAGAVDDGDLCRVGKRRAEELLEPGCVLAAQLRVTSLKKRLSSPLAVSSW